MTRALVSGYYGFGNAGDEAILAGLVEGFRALAPEVELTVLSGDPAATEAEHGVKAALRGEARKLLPHTDALISGGGGLIQNATSWASPLYYLGLMWQARRARKPVLCLGQSIGPLRGKCARFLTRYTLDRVQLVAVRDQRSAGMLHAMGVRLPVHVTADLAFLLSPPTAEECARVWSKAGLAEKHEPTVAIAVRRLPQEDNGRGGEIAETAIAACRARRLRPVLVPMQHPQDLALAEEVAAATHVGEVVRPRLTARELRALFGGFDLVVAMRLHALILAALCGCPLLGVSYDPKVDGLLGELGLSPAAYADRFERDHLTAALAAAWEEREELALRIRARSEKLRAGARANVELARQVLVESR